MNPGLSIWNRLLGVMLVLVLSAGGLLFWQERIAERASERELRASIEDRQAAFQRTSRQLSQSLIDFVVVESRTSLPAKLESGRAGAVGAELETSADVARVDWFALFGTNGELLSLYNGTQRTPSENALPIPAATLQSLANDGEDAMFFSAQFGIPMQLVFSPVRSADGDSNLGYLLAGRYWDRRYLTQLGNLVDAQINFVPLDRVGPAASGFIDGGISYQVTELGLGISGQPLFAYTVTYDLLEDRMEFAEVKGARRRVALGVVGLLVVFFAVLWKWLAFPLRLVAEALEKDDPTVLKPILNEDYDWARIAQRLTESSEARLELTKQVQRRQEQLRIEQETTKVRQSLARDLHDGVIQSVYGVGLQLDRVGRLAQKDPDKSRKSIRECQEQLNGIIGEIRGYIKGLDPKPLQGQGLKDALSQLVTNSQRSTDAKIVGDFDSESCEALSASEAINIYQIARELLSNAIRHSKASQIRIRMERLPKAVCLTVLDNGTGIDLEAARNKGNGLGNLENRARQMGGNIEFSNRHATGLSVSVTTPIK
ncbi:MAG: histidine kinase [Verrucomicrobiota bacterium]